MADEDRDGPSLELPSFGFKRKRGKKKDRAAAPQPAPPPEPTPEPTLEPEPTPVAEPEPVTEPEPAAQPEPVAQPQPVAEPEPVAQPEPVAGPEPVAQPQPEAEPEPVAETETVPVTREAPAAPPAAHDETTSQAFFADEAPPAATTVAAPAEREESEPEVGGRKRPREARRMRIGTIPGAIVTGILVGAATVGLTWGSLKLCELVRGASSCGGTGLFLLLLILVAMIFLGAGLLRFFGVDDAGSTSFLAIGLLTVVVLLFLVDLLFNWWMIVVIPCVTLLTYTLSAWVTSSFVDSGRD